MSGETRTVCIASDFPWIHAFDGLPQTNVIVVHGIEDCLSRAELERHLRDAAPLFRPEYVPKITAESLFTIDSLSRSYAALDSRSPHLSRAARKVLASSERSGVRQLPVDFDERRAAAKRARAARKKSRRAA